MPIEEKKIEKLTLLQLLIQPKSEVSVQNQTIYLYDLNTDGIKRFSELLKENEDPEIRFKNLLPCISSLVSRKNLKEKREFLPTDLINKLTKPELEQIARKYITIPSISILSKKKEDINDEIVTQKESEPIINYLDRLLIEKDKRSRSSVIKLKKLIDDSNRSGASSFLSTLGKNNEASMAFGAYDKSASALANITKGSEAASILSSFGKIHAANTALEFEKSLSASAILKSLEKIDDASQILKNFEEVSKKWERNRFIERKIALKPVQTNIENRKRERAENLNLHQSANETKECIVSLQKELLNTRAILFTEFEKRNTKTDNFSMAQIFLSLAAIVVSVLIFRMNTEQNPEETQVQRKLQESLELQQIEETKNLKLQEEIADLQIKLSKEKIIIPRKKPE